MVTLYLVRHGQTEGNVAQILQGHLPGRLTPLGWKQADGLCARLQAEHIVPDVLLSSDLQRAVDTAGVLSEAFRLPLRLTPLLRERDWGELTGRAVSQVDVKHFPPSVETVEALSARALRFLSWLLSEYDGLRVLAVTHGLFARCVQAVLTGKSIRETPRMDNVEVRSVEVTAAALQAARLALGDDLSDR